MAEYKRIKEQEDVICANDKNLIVCASAGSGKTTVMIEKIKSIIIDKKINVKNILVLTYTKAAANEMKARLLKSLLKCKKDAFLISQIDELSTADISTIHAFCEKLLKQYFYSLELDSGFEILSEEESMFMKAKAFDEALKVLRGTYIEDAIILEETYRQNEQTVKEIIFGIENFVNALADKEEWLKKQEEGYDIKTKVYQLLNTEIFESIEYYRNRCERLLKLNLDEFYVKQLNEIMIAFSPFCYKNGFLKNYEILINLKLSIIKRKQDESYYYNQIKELRNKIKAFCDNYLQRKLGSVSDIETNFSLRTVPIFIKLYRIYANCYIQRKQKENVLDFNDLEYFTMLLLKNKILCEEIKQKYKYIFIDEYQDANPMQEIIIKSIARKNNLFVVGDPKQGIYGFRQASPEILLCDMKRAENDKYSIAFNLKSNFRTNPKILDFINTIFSNIMTEETSGMNYKNTSMLKGMAEYQKDNLSEVVIDVYKAEEEFKELALGVFDVKKAIENKKNKPGTIEALIVANRILQVMQNQIYDKDEKCFRDTRYSDITVLLRGRGDFLEDFESTLKNLGLPVCSDSKDNLTDEANVLVLENLLKLVHAFNDDIALTSVMLSPLYNFNENDLAEIRLNTHYHFFYDAVLEYSQLENELAFSIQALLLDLKELKLEISVKGIYFALNKFINNKRYLLNFLNENIAVANKITDYINNFLGNKYNFNLEEFLEFSKSSNNISTNKKNEDCINITTIHSSKGLEYPIVFLCNTGTNLIKQVSMAEYKIDGELGLALKAYEKTSRTKQTTAIYEAIRYKKKRNEISEELRLLYVAMTRAKNHLFIVGSSKFEICNINSSMDVFNSRSYMDLILGSLKIDCFSSDIKTDNLEINFIDNVDELKDEKIKEEQIEVSSLELTNKIKEYLDFSYTNNSINIREKTSVTLAMKSEEDKTKFLEENDDGNTIDDGIKFHNILASVDFKIIETIEGLENYLINNKIDYQGIDIDLIFKNIMLIKSLQKDSRILKEQKFIMKIKDKEIHQDGSDDYVYMQGIIDALILGEENILIDYKYSKIKNDEKLIKKYKKQLNLYEIAAKKALNIQINQKYILSLEENKLIKIN